MCMTMLCTRSHNGLYFLRACLVRLPLRVLHRLWHRSWRSRIKHGGSEERFREWEELEPFSWEKPEPVALALELRGRSPPKRALSEADQPEPQAQLI